MAHRTRDQADVVPRTLVLNFVHLGIVQAKDLLRRAVLQIDAIGVLNQRAHFVARQIIRDIAAYLF